MSSPVYVDTSTLAKWYLSEALSEDVEAFIKENCPIVISALTTVEMRSLLARRRREGHFDSMLEQRIYAVFRSDVDSGVIIERPVDTAAVSAAANLIASFPSIPLRTLDSLHLAVVSSLGLHHLATSDKIMATTAHALDLEVTEFFAR